MSYTKDLMKVAAEWVALNPTASGKLKLPRSPESSIIQTSRAYLEECERELADATGSDADKLQSHVERLRGIHAEIDAATDSLKKSEDIIESGVNEIDMTGLAKYTCSGSSPVRSALHGRWCLAWAHAGYNVFELSNDFVAAMLLTDPRAIDFDTLRTPFPGILIVIPSGFVAGAEGMPYTKMHLSLVDGSWALYASDGAHVIDMRVAEGQDLNWEVLENLDTDDEVQDLDASAAQSIRRIVFGMLAYVTAVDRPFQERPAATIRKRSKDEERLRPRVHDVGRTIKIDPILIKHARAGSREVALQIKSRFIVRGHYRNQPHGQGRRDRKSIWISPFFKGPQDGATIVHTYKPEVGP